MPSLIPLLLILARPPALAAEASRWTFGCVAFEPDKIPPKDSLKANPARLCSMAENYLQGIGLERNPSMAELYFRRAAKLGSPRAEFRLGELWQRGLGVPANPAEAAKWFQLSANSGDPEAFASLAYLYQTGAGVPADEVRALMLYTLAASRGHAGAAYTLGFMYETGRGAPLDKNRGLWWYERAAEGGDPQAGLLLGRRYSEGDGVPKDPIRSAYYYRKAAEQGEPHAQLGLGTAYYEARGVAQDFAEARRWFEAAAAGGVTAGAFNLGMMYRLGQGVAKDSGKAAVWYRKAAEAGDADAEFELGQLLLGGEGLAPQGAEAEEWLRKAAEGGRARAALLLGQARLVGRGVGFNPFSAYALYRVAAELGSSEASAALRTFDLLAGLALGLAAVGGFVYFYLRRSWRRRAAAVQALAKLRTEAARQPPSPAALREVLAEFLGAGGRLDGFDTSELLALARAAPGEHLIAQAFSGVPHQVALSVAETLAEEEEYRKSLALLTEGVIKGAVALPGGCAAVLSVYRAAHQFDLFLERLRHAMPTEAYSAYAAPLLESRDWDGAFKVLSLKPHGKWSPEDKLRLFELQLRLGRTEQAWLLLGQIEEIRPPAAEQAYYYDLARSCEDEGQMTAAKALYGLVARSGTAYRDAAERLKGFGEGNA